MVANQRWPRQPTTTGSAATEEQSQTHQIGAAKADRKAGGWAGQGNFSEAIRVAQRIPASSTSSPKAKQQISQWQNSLEIQRASDEQKAMQQAFDAAARRDFSRAIQVAQTIRPGTRFHGMAVQKVYEWEEASRQRSLLSDHDVLSDAYELAAAGQFNAAIAMVKKLRESSSNPETLRVIDQKIREWQSAEELARTTADRAVLQEAYTFAANGQFEQAIGRARTIPASSRIHTTVSRKIRDWSRMRDIRNRAAAQTS